MFADDCLLYAPVTSTQDQDKLQKDLLALEEWTAKWGMRFNAKKCYVLRISRSKTPYTRMYTLDKHVLQEVDSNPYLGYQLSNDLKPAKHISIITGKANRTLGFLRRNLRKCPMDLKSTAYKSLVCSVLEYVASAWDPYLAKDEHQLEMVQRRAARFVMNEYRQTSSITEMLNQLGWSELSQRQQEARLTLLFKIVKGLVAVEFNQLTPNTSCRGWCAWALKVPACG